jgi:hypothetical protein
MVIPYFRDYKIYELRDWGIEKSEPWSPRTVAKAAMARF